MRVLVLGGTGSIGTPLVRELVQHGHEVLALARSQASETRLSGLGALPIPGDISSPDRWLGELPPLEALVHVAATFTEEEESIDRRLLEELLPLWSEPPPKRRFIYTGGCWLFGATDGRVATEETPFNPLPAFAWSVPHLRRVLGTSGMVPIVIHPAMVYEASGGIFRRFYEDALHRDAVRIVAGEHVRWPLVHAEDLAVLYRLALESGAAGESYIGSAVEGLPVGRIARAYARRFGTPRRDPEVISEAEFARELGPWARGYALDQLLSGEKARRCLGWEPRHLDPEREIGELRAP
jgi:nucleoside-diphosphate-sugar epimerase